MVDDDDDDDIIYNNIYIYIKHIMCVCMFDRVCAW